MRHPEKIGKFFLIWFFFCLINIGQLARADVSVTATVDRTQMEPGDTLTLVVRVITTDGEEIESDPVLPDMTQFEVLNQWSSSDVRHRMDITSNGPKFINSMNQGLNYILQPKKEGKLTIGPVEVRVGDKVYSTKSIDIEVGKGLGMRAPPSGRNASRNQKGRVIPPPGYREENEDDSDDLFSQLLNRSFRGGSRTLPVNPNEAFFIQVETDKDEAYVGEQINVSWYLYTRGRVVDFDTLKYPSLKGFWKEDIEISTHLNFTSEVINGIPYYKALLASYALFPIKEGKATIDSYTAKCSVVASNDTFGAMLGLGKPYVFTKTSKPVRIQVDALPLEGRPTDFSGAVGDYQVTARVEDHHIVSGQPFLYKVRFEGAGNAKLIDQPPFQIPEGMELYGVENEAKFFKTGTSYKDFNFQLIPRREGEFTLPGFTVSVFDPKLKKYVAKSVEPIKIIVGKGANLATMDTKMDLPEVTEENPKKKFEPPLLVDFVVVDTLTDEQKSIGLGGLYFLVLVLLVWKSRSSLGWGQKKQNLSRVLKRRIRKAEQKIEKGDWRGVGVDITNLVYHVMGEISGQGGASLEIDKLLLKAPPSVRRELSEPLKKQMELFQVLSFAPESVVGDLKEKSKLRQSLNELTKTLEAAIVLSHSNSGTSSDSTEMMGQSKR